MIRGGSVRKEELQIDRDRVEVPTDPGSWREDDEFGTRCQRRSFKQTLWQMPLRDSER